MKNLKRIMIGAILLTFGMMLVSGCGKEVTIETEIETEKETEEETTEESLQETSEETAVSNKEYQITLSDSKSNDDLIKDCPNKANVGKEVTIHLYDVTDVIPRIFVNGEEAGTFTDDYTYVFTMPDMDVLIESKLESAWESGESDTGYILYDMGGIGSFEYASDCEIKKENMAFLIKRDVVNDLENDAPYIRINFMAFKEGETVEDYYSILFSNVQEYYADRTGIEVYENEYPVDGRKCPGFEYVFSSEDGKRMYARTYILDQFSDGMAIYEDFYLVSSEYEEDQIDDVTEKDFEHLLSTIHFDF